MSSAPILVATAILLAGRAALALLPTRRSRSRLERAGASALMGLALLPAWVTLKTALISPLGILEGRVLLGIVGLAGILVLARPTPRPEHSTPPSPPESWRKGQVLLLAGALFFAAFAVFQPASMPVHVFDPIYHFAYKGKLLFQEGFGTPSWTDVEGPVGRVITHPDYPPGIPALHALMASAAGRFSEDATKALFSLFVLAPAALLFASLRPRGRTPALAGALLWLALPILYYTRSPNEHPLFGFLGLFIGPLQAQEWFPSRAPWALPDGWTLDGAGDLPLAALFFGAYLHLARLGRARGPQSDPADAWIGGICLGGALLVKNEGLALAPLLMLALLLGRAAAELGASPRSELASWSQLTRGLALASGLAVLLCAAWLWQRRLVPSIDEGYPSRLTPANLLDNTDRAMEVAGGFLASWSRVLRWHLLWPLFFATLIWALGRPRALSRHPALPGVLVVLGACLLYSAILLVTPWELERLFQTVIPGRLLLHVAPITVFAALSLAWCRPEERT